MHVLNISGFSIFNLRSETKAAEFLLPTSVDRGFKIFFKKVRLVMVMASSLEGPSSFS